LRTYADHRRGEDPLVAPGSCDITADVPLEPVRAAIAAAGLDLEVETTQAEWLAGLGIEALVEEGRRIWEAGAARGDLAAIAGRSRAVEASTLTDPGGLGGFTVLGARRVRPR
jgi:SAM-dependent MidA family methyltransferase